MASTDGTLKDSSSHCVPTDDEKRDAHNPDFASPGDTVVADPTTDAAANADAAPKRSITGLKASWFLAYSSILSTVLLLALDNTIVADIQPSIVDTFQSQEILAWVGVSFVLGQTLILPIGKSFGMFNMKLLYVGSIILFEIGSAICGAAPNMTALIIGRVIAGIGGSGVYVGGMTYVSVLTMPNERPIYLAGIMSIWGIGNVLGPIVGGGFAESSATWRWGFYINLPIAALFAPGILFCLPNIKPMPDKSIGYKLRQQDWVGLVLFVALWACFAMAGSFGGTCFDWKSGSEIALWVMFGVLLIAFVLATKYHPFVSAEKKLLPVHFMRTRTKDIIILPISAFLVAGCMFMSIYYTPLIFQFTHNDGPLEAGVRILPLICMLVFGSLLNGVLMPKLGYYMPWFVVGNALMLVGAALVVTIDTTTSDSAIYGYTVLIGLGVGCYQSAGVAVVSALAPPEEVTNAVSLMTVGQVMGTILALAVSGSVYENKALEYLAEVLPNSPRSDLEQLLTGSSGSFYAGLSSSVKDQVIQQVTYAIRETFYYMLVSTALGLVVSLFLSRRKLFAS